MGAAMAHSGPAYFSMVCLLFLSFAASFSPTSVVATAAAAPDGTAHDRLLRCFLSHSLPSNLVYTPNTTAYYDVFRSSIQNARFLTPDNPRPVFIVTPTEEAHAQAAVLCSRRHGLRVRVRSGGHDHEGLSYVAVTNSSGPFLVIDLAHLRAIDVDMETRTVWVGAGSTLGELYYNIAQESSTIAFPAGACPTIGVGGHISGGGIGTMHRKYGLAADHVVDARLVDAQGRIVDRASMGEDLFWAIRGGGGASFGVLLAYRIRLVDVTPTVSVFGIYKTLEQNATALLTRWLHIADRFDDDFFTEVNALAVGEAGPNRTIAVAFMGLYFGGAEALLAYIGEVFPELGVQATDLLELSWIDSVKFFAAFPNQSTEVNLLDRTPHFDSSLKTKSDILDHPISEGGWEDIWGFLLNSTSESMAIIIYPLGGRMDEVPAAATPFPHRKGSRYLIHYYQWWFETEEAANQRHLQWTRELYAFMAPYVSCNPRAAYVNYRDIDLGRNEGEGGGSYKKAKEWGRKYFKGNFKRLASVKGEVDPDNFFWNEQSIPPLFALDEKNVSSEKMLDFA